MRDVIVRRGAGRADRLHRAERRREVDLDQDAHRHPPRHRRRGPGARATSRGTSARRLARRIGTLFGQRSQLWFELTPRQSYPHAGRHPRPRPRGRSAPASPSSASCSTPRDLFDQPVRSLSLGQRMRCELAACLLHEPEIAVPRRAHDRPRPAGQAAVPRAAGAAQRRARHHDLPHLARRRRHRGTSPSGSSSSTTGSVIYDDDGRRHAPHAARHQARRGRPRPRRSPPPDLDGVTVVDHTDTAIDLVGRHDPARRSATCSTRCSTDWPVADISVVDPPLEQVIAEIYTAAAPMTRVRRGVAPAPPGCPAGRSSPPSRAGRRTLADRSGLAAHRRSRASSPAVLAGSLWRAAADDDGDRHRWRATTRRRPHLVHRHVRGGHVALAVPHDRERRRRHRRRARSPASCCGRRRCSACASRRPSGAALPRLGACLAVGVAASLLIVGRAARPGRARLLAASPCVLAVACNVACQHAFAAGRVLAPRRRVDVVPLPEVRVHPRRHADAARGAARLAGGGRRASCPSRRWPTSRPGWRRATSSPSCCALQAGWLVVAHRPRRCRLRPRRAAPAGGRRMRARAGDRAGRAVAEARGQPRRVLVAGDGDGRQRPGLGRRSGSSSSTGSADVRGWDADRVLLLLAVPDHGRRPRARPAGQRPPHRRDGGRGRPRRRAVAARPAAGLPAGPPGRGRRNLGDVAFGIVLFARGRAPRPSSAPPCSSPPCCRRRSLLTGFLVAPGSLAFFAGRGEAGELGLHAMLHVRHPTRPTCSPGRPRPCSTPSCRRPSCRPCPPRLIDDFDLATAATLVGVAAFFAVAGWATFTLGLRRYTSGATWTRA